MQIIQLSAPTLSPSTPSALLRAPSLPLVVIIVLLRALTVPLSTPSVQLRAPTVPLVVIIVLLRALTVPLSTPSALLSAPTLPLAVIIVLLSAPTLPLSIPFAPLRAPTLSPSTPSTPLRASLILFPRFIFTNSGHDIIIANTDIHISRPDFSTTLLSTSPETREKTKKVAITCEKGTFQLPFRTLSPLFRPFQSLSNISFISSFTVIWSL